MSQSSPTYRLHYFPESGNSYKLALMLTLCGQSFEPVWTDFGGGVTRTPEWRATVNEMGEIPVLEENGERLTQTAPILLRLAERHGRFGAKSEAERFEILRWLFWDNHKLTGFMATYRYNRAFLRSVDPVVLDFMRRRIEAGYDFAVSHPAVNEWLLRMAALHGWKAPYDLLPGKRLHCYV
jgi:glutathione S-transferase